MQITSDNELNTKLKEEVQELRSIINKGVELNRFQKIPCSDKPRYIIIDNFTGKSAEVPLFALSEVMQVLKDLFE